ncbi:hypothetical protein M8J77_017204 [Diaphorina citri]|nr:hypothetical protein M8J77_017204 [Diaphorina citri]
MDASVRRIQKLVEHLQECVSSCATLKEALADSSQVDSVQSQIKVQKLRNSNDRVVREVKEFLTSNEELGDEAKNVLDEANNLQITAEDLLVELDIYMKPKESPSLIQPAPALPHASSRGNLPKLQLPVFNGDILKWTEFWDRFTSVVDRRTDILEVDKLAYFVGSVEEDAKQAIEGLELTNANYKLAVQKLKDRFGKPNLIIDAHYAALNRIPVAVNTTTDLRRALDTVERHMRTLETLGEDINHNQLRTTVMEKFPQEIIYELRMDMESSGHSVKTLRETLEKIVSARETSFAMTQAKVGSSQLIESFTTESLLTTVGKPRPSSGNKGQFRRKPDNPRKSSLGRVKSNTYVLSNKRRDRQPSPIPASKKRKLECIYCKGDHYNDACKEVSTIDARKRILLKERLCFVCLRSDHLSDKCTYKRRCYHCNVNGDHNRSICPSQFKPSKTSSSTLATA